MPVAIPLCLGLVVLAIVVGRTFRQIEAEDAAHGDVARVPEEMRLPSNKVGGRPQEAGEPVTNADTNQQTRPSHLDVEASK